MFYGQKAAYLLIIMVWFTSIPKWFYGVSKITECY